MDLALEFGMPVSMLSKVLKERELKQWAAYSRKYILPTRRRDLYLAQVSMILAKVNGAKDVSLEDFMFDPPPEIDPVHQLKAAIEAFGFKPRKKRGK